MNIQTPPANCPLCPRLVGYRETNQGANPAWFNGAVPSFGPLDARFLVVGLAPGVRGANRTGRPFTGDFAGVLLYRTLIKYGFATGTYGADPADGIALRDCRVTNAVRCVPPANLPTPAEITGCNPFLTREMAAMPRLRVVLALGGVSHKAVLRARGLRASHTAFAHGAVHTLPDGLLVVDSYHVSRLNTNTGRLTTPMFEAVIADILARLT
ncbi:MAG: uracil-DNA glycosylase [Acetobacteraceae bacterium]|jgi:uracil-DNA glycosylase family 4|nr:uracil-DNA glycosylase [Rhodopila sp.]MEA2729267.1 uracil-DNA glycosylase [Acetobacteraceae bacterium]MEA2771254.1 uracil-DNA glycosylase [Acetobacteraceae bacterium]